jgi:hypothetical protein
MLPPFHQNSLSSQFSQLSQFPPPPVYNHSFISLLEFLFHTKAKNNNRQLGFLIPETVVFSAGQISCVFSQDKNRIVTKNENVTFISLVKMIKKINQKIQYVLKWKDGKLPYNLSKFRLLMSYLPHKFPTPTNNVGTSELLTKNEMLHLLMDKQGEMSKNVQKLHYFYRDFKSETHLVKFNKD